MTATRINLGPVGVSKVYDSVRYDKRGAVDWHPFAPRNLNYTKAV